MKITNLKINNFGKLQNKEINFNDNINIIYGKNEAGKSTLLKFIISMFYGLSKNKNGKEITDFEKYTPWTGEEFSGKIKYELNNKEQFEIYREFNKKNPKIFNENIEDISAQFNIDKTKGNQFFYDQTKIDEELFISTIVSEQGEIKLDSKNQTTLVQKLSNIIATGEDNISFQKVMNKLNKKQLEEIGTKRSQDRPINIIQNRLQQLQQEKEELLEYQDKKYEIEEEQQIFKKMQKIKEIKDANKLEQEKININKNNIENYNKELINLKEQLEAIKPEKINKKNNTKIIIAILAIAISIAVAIFIENTIIKFIPMILTIVYIAVQTISQKNKKMWITKVNKEKEIQKEKIKGQIEILENQKQEQEQKIKTLENQIKANFELQKQGIINEINNESNIEAQIANMQNAINELQLKKHRLELDNENILPKLENMAEIEETLANLNQQYKELIQYDESIEMAKQEIEKAYEEMKQNVTPKFTEKLSNIIKHISNNKYKNVRFNSEKGITVELENGNYTDANKLSIGTIDQLYLALRLSTIDEISEEKLPILLDEPFAYFDEERLTNILKYIKDNYTDRQVMIFTCTDREKNILDRINIKYKLIELSN